MLLYIVFLLLMNGCLSYLAFLKATSPMTGSKAFLGGGEVMALSECLSPPPHVSSLFQQTFPPHTRLS